MCEVMTAYKRILDIQDETVAMLIENKEWCNLALLYKNNSFYKEALFVAAMVLDNWTVYTLLVKKIWAVQAENNHEFTKF